MEFCPIVPTMFLEKYATTSRWQMALAPMCLKEPKYFDFYRKRVDAGNKVILDNGEYEGKQVGKEEYIRLIKELEPYEYVLPDKIKDTKETYRMAVDFPIPNAGCRRMFVVHDTKEPLGLEGTMANTIGLPKWMGTDRTRVAQMYGGYILHALGFISTSPLGELPELNSLGVRSIDSSEPFRQAFFGMNLIDHPRPFSTIWNNNIWNDNGKDVLSYFLQVYQLCGSQTRFADTMKFKQREHDQEEKLQFTHTSGSRKPRFGLIPHEALVAMADRFELGEKKHEGKTWNALAKNQEGLKDREWIIARIEHVVHHAYQFLQKYEGIIPDDGDDDAGAIMWGGACLSEARRVKNAKS